MKSLYRILAGLNIICCLIIAGAIVLGYIHNVTLALLCFAINLVSAINNLKE